MLNSPPGRKHKREINQGNSLRNATTALAARKKKYYSEPFQHNVINGFVTIVAQLKFRNCHYSQLSEK